MNEGFLIPGETDTNYTVKSALFLIIYNGPGVTAKVFEAIKKATTTKMYVCADGEMNPREMIENVLYRPAKSLTQ